MTLAQFQDQFADALFSHDVPSGAMEHIARQPGFAIYRNTVMKGCIDALRANYPAVARLVGEEWFHAAASLYVVGHPPRDPRLLLFGDAFAGFLQRFEPAQALPYLPGVAHLDRFWSEAHAASDETVLDAAALSAMAPDDVAHLVLRPHASARWMWCDSQPVFSIWERSRTASAPDSDDLVWRGEGALLVRPQHAVAWHPLDAAGCAFLDACGNGLTLADAAAAALFVKPDANLAALLAMLLQAGAFSQMRRLHTGPLFSL